MRSRSRCLGALLLLVAIIFPAFAADKDDKKDDTPKPAAEKAPMPVPSSDKWTTVGDMIGTLDKVNGTSISLKVDYQETSLQRYGKTVRPKAVTKSKDVDLMLADDVKVRIGAPPLEFDDKGSIKKYSPEELKTLKGGDSKTWGYASDTNALKTGEMVRVIVARKKATTAKSKDAPAEDNQPVVRLIYILKDADGKGGGDKPVAKKK